MISKKLLLDSSHGRRIMPIRPGNCLRLPCSISANRQHDTADCPGLGPRQALAKVVENDPIPAIHGVIHWRFKDLFQWIFQEFHISIDEMTIECELRVLGFAKLSARPCHYAQNELETATFKKNSPSLWQKSGPSSCRAWTSNSSGPMKRA
ncbi:hypothetical protein PanWU01x14_300550 [Parasponia andersonii]|uniref:Winged helix-turn helix domain-containing protein n=1 Tax=Parasponia andersonii TaxID=3476 RepID=A0A2P5AU33_PARAD|nr:hypothetical protein PanWU01x14_300550 [Parasponia andersonii]